MNTSKMVFFLGGLVFTVYMADIYLKTLKPPDHIHSRDDVPAERDQQGPSPSEIARLEARLAEQPDNIDLILQLGHIYLNTRRYEKAEKIFSKAVKMYPDNAEMLVDLGVALRGLSRINESLTLLIQATQQFPEYGDGWLQLAVLYRFNLKDNIKALVNFEKYLSLEDEGETAFRVRQEVKRIKNEMP